MASEQEKQASDQKGAQENSRHKILPWARSRQLERNLEHVNREIYRRNLELAQTNKTLALLQAIDGLVLNSDDALEPLATKLAKEVVKVGFPFVMIMGYPPARHTDLEPFGWATPNNLSSSVQALIPKFRLRTRSSWFKRQDVLKFVALENLSDAELASYCHISETEAMRIRQELGVKAVCCTKLSARQRLVGVMVVGFTDHQQDHLGEFEKTLFIRLSEAVGIAIDHKMLLEENQRIVGQLERSNRQLRLLDRTKDDFISMASHQLRTPLTSVKGYISMVLEGDGGKLNEQQAKLLTQAFVSSQRMVYLISDLLNVSRLKTGKFVIETVPVNLADVIEEEVAQLQETAKGRNLELKFHKPQDFPSLMLDETKLRQVIMNFIDNAVYYTPTGGHIEVHLTETPQSVEFTVVDDGMGVPKREQHHLFSKFYRAHNAKRARPDGTGLGLFMAKKVIVAQGGATIFRSQEGKGSTFGFTFPKAKLLPEATEIVPSPKK
jgi:signal transduction histidine kinase